MKNIFYILLLLPTIIFAQYPSNSGQKITLGEQTTADGLVYRGLAADTTRKPSVDTMAFILLDTNTNIIWQYKKAVNNAWTRVGGSISSGVTGVLPVANGGTNLSSFFLDGVLYASSTNQIATNSNLTYDGTMLKLISTAAGGVSNSQPNPSYPFRLINSPTAGQGSYNVFDMRMERNGTENRHPNFSFSTDATNGEFFNIAQIGVIAEQGSGNLIKGNLLFMTKPENAAPTERMRVTSAGEVWIGYTAGNGAYPLQVNGQIFATSNIIATSDEKFKENITPLNKGLEIINKLKPVTFNFISDTKNNFSEYEEVGFIAQDVDRALSTETFAKSIVKSADDSEPTSTMGLATQNLIPILVKAIQEQQALIKALEQRILILENK